MTTQRSWPTHNCMHLMLLNVQLHLVHNTHILLLLLSLIGVHSLLVVVDGAHAIDVVNCARTTLLLLITHTHHTRCCC